MARMLHEELLRQLGLIEEVLKRIRSLAFNAEAISRSGRPELAAYVSKNIENLANECNSLVALFGNFVATLKEISSECEVRLSLFRALPKQLQERYKTEYGLTNKVEFLLKLVEAHAKELIAIITLLSKNLVNSMASLKQGDISLVNKLTQNLERSTMIMYAKGIADDFAEAVELQNALASEAEAKAAKPSLLSRLFGFKPAPATT